MIKAVIMAGGEGSRLRPLTCDLPKPMARLCGRPVVDYILDLLVQHHITSAVLTLGYLPQKITDYFEGAPRGDIALSFSEEDRPMGTAGSVRYALGDRVDDDVLVISGDAMCDFDLTAAIAAHKKTKADVTILVKSVEDPREYGLVCADATGRVQGFVEKPSYYQVSSEYANTGIYILSPSVVQQIPKGQKYDFAKDLFPKLLQQSNPLYAQVDSGYWCDIGDLSTYLRCQQDILSGLVRCNTYAKADPQGNLFKTTRPKGNYTLHPPVYIGAGVQIGDGAIVASHSILDSRSRLGENAKLRGSLLLEHATVGYGAAVTGSIVCAGAKIAEKAMVFEHSTIGAAARIGAGAVLAPQVKVWPGKVVAPKSSVSGLVKQNITVQSWFDDDGIGDDGCMTLTPELCARIGGALGGLSGGQIGLGCAQESAAQLYKTAFAAGAQAAGCKVLDFGGITRPQYNFAMHLTGAQVGAYIKGGQSMCIQITAEAGLPASRSLERQLENAISHGESMATDRQKIGSLADVSGIWELYCSRLGKLAPEGLEGIACTVKSGSPQIERQAREIIAALGGGSIGGFTLWLDPSCQRVSLYQGEGAVVPYHRLLAVVCGDEFARGHDVALPFDAPRSIDSLAREMGRQVLHYYACPVDDTDKEARALAATQFWSRDSLMLTVRLLDIYRRSGKKLEDLVGGTPHVFITERSVPITMPPGKVIGKLSQGGVAQPEGGLIHRSDAAAFVRAGKNGRHLHIFAESATAEAAAELCADLERQINRMTAAKTES